MEKRNFLPACVQACPTSALTFADQGDPTGPVYQVFKDVNEHEHEEERKTRGYRLLEEMGTKPNVIYLMKVDQFPLPKSGDNGG
jgi:molybdopterin-containing oxidoreductase family iron-sulfur binding subunit